MSYFLEQDDSFKRAGVWRIVSSEAVADRRHQNSSMRPVYIATVYDVAIAQKICDLLNREIRRAACKAQGIPYLPEDE